MFIVYQYLFDFILIIIFCMKSEKQDQNNSHPSNLNFQQTQKEKTTQIKISICTPQQKSQLGGASKFYIYPLKGHDKLGEIDIIRRYSDFDLLRNILVVRWPGSFITSLPQKKFIGNNEQLFLKQRKDGLEQFLQLISQVDYLWYSQEVQLFLKNNTGQTDKIISKLKQVRNQQLLKRFQQKFPELFKNQINPQANNKILTMSQFLKQSITMIQNLEKMSEQIYMSRKKYSEKYLNLVEFLLPDYEQNCIKVYQQVKNSNPQNEIFKGNHAQYLKQSISDLKQQGFINPVLNVLQEIRRQKFQISAFQQTLKIKDHYFSLKQKSISKVKELELQANKIQAGNSSILAKITNKSKEEQIKLNEHQMQNAKQEQKQLSLICDIITAHLAYSQIDLFKKNREKAYYRLLKNLALAQRKSGQIKKKLWIQIGKHQHINLKVQQNNQPKKQEIYKQEKHQHEQDQHQHQQQQEKHQHQHEQHIQTQHEQVLQHQHHELVEQQQKPHENFNQEKNQNEHQHEIKPSQEE